MKTWIATAAALALVSGLAAAQETDPAGKIDALIQQLGSDDYAAREKATEELRKIGPPAREALRKAAENPDPEIQSRARALLKEIEKPEKAADGAAPRRGPRFNFAPGLNGLRGGALSVTSSNNDTTWHVMPGDGRAPFTFHRSADGAVKLEYTDDKEEKKTAGSESLEKFLKDHKELAGKFGISENGIDYGGLRAGFGQDGAPRPFPFNPGFRFRLEDLIPPGGEDDVPRRAGRAPGASFEIPSDTVRAQLGIPEGEGVVVTRVAPGSDAEAAGLLRHDILLEIDGRKVTSAREAHDLLKKPGAVTVLRKGRRQTLPAKAEDGKDF